LDIELYRFFLGGDLCDSHFYFFVPDMAEENGVGLQKPCHIDIKPASIIRIATQLGFAI
jgi:hypothetical protein